MMKLEMVVFTSDEVTDDGNVPKEENMGIRVSAGTAYVKGFDIDHVGNSIIDVPKPRTTKPLQTARIPFAGGSLLELIMFMVLHTSISDKQQVVCLVIILFHFIVKEEMVMEAGGTLNGTGTGSYKQNRICKSLLVWSD